MTWTTDNKNSSSVTNDPSAGNSLTLNQETGTWNDAEGTWDNPRNSWVRDSANSSSITNDAKI